MSTNTPETVPVIALNDGTSIPQLGFGVFQVKPSDTKAAVLTALEIGYRHLDTAEMYRNEAEVGAAIAESGLPREEIYVTSKLANGSHDPEKAQRRGHESVEKLGGPMDLFLIHWPLATVSDFVPTWEAMQKLQADGATKSIGVSNFQVAHLERLAEAGGTVPAVNQIELHPYLTQVELSRHCAERGIAVEAWSPIAQGAVLDDQVIVDIAKAHDRTAAQVTLRWHVQLGNIIFPKSVTPARVKENFEIFDFALSDEEMTAISGLNRDFRSSDLDPDTFAWIPDWDKD